MLTDNRKKLFAILTWDKITNTQGNFANQKKKQLNRKMN